MNMPPPVQRVSTITDCDIAVIGAGASGLAAAIAAGRAGRPAYVFERNDTPGRKIALAGGGRCNFSNTLTEKEFVRRFGPGGRKLGAALAAFSSREIVSLLESRGVDVVVEDGFKLFPASGNGRDVVGALVAEARALGTTIVPDARVNTVSSGEDGFQIRLADGRAFRTKKVIICTGGKTYPKTGSTGDGYRIAERFGHTITPLKSGLIGMKTLEAWVHRLAGIAFEEAVVSLYPPDGKGRPVATETGAVLFTHFGVSGPAVLNLSNVYASEDMSDARLRCDVSPGMTRPEFEQFIDRMLLVHSRQFAVNAFDDLPPRRYIEYIFSTFSDTHRHLRAAHLPKLCRRRIVAHYKDLWLDVSGTRAFRHGEVTIGGVPLNEINVKTMESNIVPGAYFSGEILDLQGRCGGFNLQAAFSTGYAAGKHAAESVNGR